jgi:hypothetical protein
LDWSSDRNWWITAFVGLSDLYVKGNIGFGILDRISYALGNDEVPSTMVPVKTGL